MNLLKAFDTALAASENTPKGYRIGENIYENYLQNDAWEAFLADMCPIHRKQFNDGSGSELESKRDRPPKMASFASSSRMIYRLCNKIEGFSFEKRLATTVGGYANLDGYLALPGREIYIEAKCREPYGHSADQTIKQNYRGVYSYLCKQMPDTFSCSMQNIPESGPKLKNEMHVTFFCKGRPVVSFDIKQMICHLLAVATKRLREPADTEILFLYLLYDPASLPLSEDAETAILHIHADTCRTAEGLDIPRMFSHIVDYLRSEKGIAAEEATAEQLKKAFQFRLCSQNDYETHLR